MTAIITRSAFRETYVRPVLLGSVDGLITTFVVVAAGLASDTSRASILLIGASSLVADGLSMGVSEALSSRAQDDIPARRAALLGLACFLGFVVAGCAPLLGYAISQSPGSGRIVSILFFLCGLAVVGMFRAWITEKFVASETLEVLVLGAASGGVAYSVALIRV